MSFVMYMYCLLHADVLSCPDYVITAIVAQYAPISFRDKPGGLRFQTLLQEDLSFRAAERSGAQLAALSTWHEGAEAMRQGAVTAHCVICLCSQGSGAPKQQTPPKLAAKLFDL